MEAGAASAAGGAAVSRESTAAVTDEARACRRSICVRLRAATAAVSVLRRKGRERRRPRNQPPLSNSSSKAADKEAFIAGAARKGLNFYVATLGQREPVRGLSLQYRRLTMPSP